MSTTKAKREPASERRLAAAAPVEPLVDRLTSLREYCHNDHLFLATIKSINDQTASLFDLIDRAAESGQMSPLDHGLRAAAAGGSAADAIAYLFQLRGALEDIENEISQLIKAESEAST